MAKFKFVSILLQSLKFFGIALVVIFGLFGIASWIVVEKKNDWLLDEIQSYMNESQSGQLNISSIDLKLFRSFPDVSIEFDSIDYYEHRDSLRTADEQPILHASQLFIALKLFPLMKDELIVSEISLANAQLNIVELEDGVLNIERALAHPARKKIKEASVVPKPPTATSPIKKEKNTPKPSPPPGIQIDLQLIDLREILFTWKSFANPKPSVIQIKKVRADLVKNKNVFAVNLTSTHQIQSLTIKKVRLPPGELRFSSDIRFEVDQQLLTIKESELGYNEFSATLQGSYAHQKNQLLDVLIDASSNDMKFLAIFLKPKIIKQNPNLLKQGDIYVKGRVFGELKKQSPQFDISFGVKDLDLQLPNKLGSFKNIGFKGSFSSGSSPDYSKAKFEINRLNGQLPGGFLKGRFRLNNFVAPYVSYKLDGKLKLDGYDEIFRIDFLKQLRGNVSVQANFEGPLKMFSNHQLDSSRWSLITLDSLSFIVAKTNKLVSGLSGTMETRKNQTTLRQLALTYGENDLVVNATVDNLMHLIFKQESDISVAAHVQSNTLFTKDFIPDTLLTAEVRDKISNLSFDLNAKTTANKTMGTSGLPDIAFDIHNLAFQLDKLPDVKKVDASGLLSETAAGLKLDLHEFHATMPFGKLDVAGDLLIPEKKLWQFNAKVTATKFPWTYVMELVDEIQDDKEPGKKNLAVKDMEIVTADLDLSAAIITFPFDITKLEVRNSRINFVPTDSKPIAVEKVSIALEGLYFSHPINSGAITGLKSTTGRVEMKQLSVPGLKKFDITLNLTGKNDLLDIDFSSATQKAKSEKGKLSLNISGKEPQYHFHFAVQEANLENYIKRFYKKKLMRGDIDYMLDMQTTGLNWASAKQNLKGDIVITGDSLLLYGVDIDKVLETYEQSQNFNLTDLGAVLIAGPIGLAVTKGSDLVSLATINLDSTHRTMIKTLVTKWKLENRQLITQDVAFSTSQNRIAFDGSIDFAHDSIPGLTIAVIDKNGCSLMDQKLHGKMGDLKTGKLNVTKTLLGSVINFANAIVGKDCKPVYTGIVQDPLH